MEFLTIQRTSRPKTSSIPSQLHGANLEEIANIAGCKRSEILDFSSNLNPFGPSKNAEISIIENTGNIYNYPQNDNRLKAALSNYLEVNKNNLFIDNGSAAIIYKLFGFLNLKKAAILKPTFSEYENAAAAHECKVSGLAFSGLTNPASLANKLSANGALFVCNPNNPTATLFDISVIKSLAKKTEKDSGFLIIDEAFMDFVANKNEFSVIKLVENIPNLIVIGSLTKFFALAGLRTGYLCANKNFIKKFRRYNPPWPVNILTLEASCASLFDTSYIKKTQEEIPKLRKYLTDKLKAIKKIEVFESKINFVLAELDKPLTSTFLYEELAKRKILIRDCASFGMGSRYIRLAVKTKQQTDRLIKNLCDVINEIS